MTPAPLPPEIRVERVRDDIAYALPVRPLGKLRWVGLALVAISIVFDAMPARELWSLFQTHAVGRSQPGDVIPVILLIPFLAAGLLPMIVGFAWMFGRCRIEWRDRRLSTVEALGPLRWRRRLAGPKNVVRKLSVTMSDATVNGQPVTTGPFASLAALTMELESGKPRTVALGYPKEWLHALAADLSARIGAAAPLAGAPRVELVDPKVDVLNDPIVEQPPNSSVKIEPAADGFALVIPPAGLWKGSRGLFGFGLFWCLFMCVFTAICVLPGLHNKRNSVPGVFWIFIPVFWAIGLGLLASAVNMGRRRARLVVAGGRLRIAQQSLLGARVWEWPRENLAAIRADRSGMEVNSRPLLELQVHPAGAKKVGLLAGRGDDELRWIAAELRRALRVPAMPETGE